MARDWHLTSSDPGASFKQEAITRIYEKMILANPSMRGDQRGSAYEAFNKWWQYLRVDNAEKVYRPRQAWKTTYNAE